MAKFIFLDHPVAFILILVVLVMLNIAVEKPTKEDNDSPEPPM